MSEATRASTLQWFVRGGTLTPLGQALLNKAPGQETELVSGDHRRRVRVDEIAPGDTSLVTVETN